jgi:SAM-dependent methyltransferase
VAALFRRDSAGDKPEPQETPPYTALAAVYDVVMEHVEYDVWAQYIDQLIRRHLPDAKTVLELGCGTGSLAFELQPLGPYRYHGIDSAAPMVHVAREKAEMFGGEVGFDVGDFTNFRVEPPVDVAVLLYDGVNYLLEEEALRSLFHCAAAAVRQGGLFILDQSTPANSLNNADFFEDEGEEEDFRYVRRSTYDRNARLHTTSFEIELDGEHYRETHLQRAYDKADMESFISDSPFDILEAFDNLTREPATGNSERIHWVLRRREAG